MKSTLSQVGGTLLAAGTLLVCGCGGGEASRGTSDGGNSAATGAVGSGGTASTDASSGQLNGTAATGAALANATVSITDASNGNGCIEPTITTTATGGYACTLKPGAKPPLFIVVNDNAGATGPLVSIATESLATQTSHTVNATTLTTAIVGQLNGGDALGVVRDKTKFRATDFNAIKANVVSQLQPVLSAAGVPVGYDPFTTRMTAATPTQVGDASDKVLDFVKITTDSSGKPALAILGNATPVALATREPASATLVMAPPAGASGVSIAAQQLAKKFTGCFALPVAQRVLKIASPPPSYGGPEAAQLATACVDIASDGSNANNAPAFKNDGLSAGQFFYSLLVSDRMTGAQFSVPEVSSFSPASTTRAWDQAAMNIRYVDASGKPGNVVVVASNIPDSSTPNHPGTWWLTGNGKNAESLPSPTPPVYVPPVYVPPKGCESVSEETCKRAVALGRGINMGNMLEAPREGDWGLRLEPAYIDLVQGKFSTIRLPVRWSNHAAVTADATLDEVFASRVTQGIDYMLAKGFYVILNMHHYNQLFGDALLPYESGVAPEVVEARFINMWRQIAVRYKDHSPKLLFELLNEPHNALSDAAWSQLATKALAVVRQSNPTRTVLIGPADYNNISGIANLRMPADPNLIAAVHSYDPFFFTHQGATWLPFVLPTGVTCCSADQRNAVTTLFDAAVTWRNANGYPLHLGEFGSLQDIDAPSREAYTRMVRDTAESRGIAWTYWEFGSGFGVYSPQTQSWVEPIRRALLD